MKNKLLTYLAIIVVIVAVISLAFQYFGEKGTEESGTSASTSTSITGASSTAAVDTSNWTAYVGPGYSIQHPSNLLVNDQTTVQASGIQNVLDATPSVTFTFSKEDYFSTVLQDNVVVAVTATSTCTALPPSGGPVATAPVTIQAKGATFTRTETTDVGAGNLYTTFAYDTVHAGTCYRLTYFNHGTNGAGFYLSDQTAIQQADATHAQEIARISAIVDAMVSTFSFTTASAVPVIN